MSRAAGHAGKDGLWQVELAGAEVLARFLFGEAVTGCRMDNITGEVTKND